MFIDRWWWVSDKHCLRRRRWRHEDFVIISSSLHWGADLLLSFLSSVLGVTSVLLWAGVAPMSLAMSSTHILLLPVHSYSCNSCSSSISASISWRGGVGVVALFCNVSFSVPIVWSVCGLGITNYGVVSALAWALVVVAGVVKAWKVAMRASAASPLSVLAASCCSLANILLWNSGYPLLLSPRRIWLTCSVVILPGVILAAAASVLSCWVGHQTLLLSSDSVWISSSQSSGSYSSVSSYLLVIFHILLRSVVWESMVVVGKVVDVGRLTVRRCEVVVGSTGVLLQCSVDRRYCSEDRDGDSLCVLLQASAIIFFLPSMCSIVITSWLRLSCYLIIIWLVCKEDIKATSGCWSVRIVTGCSYNTPLKCLTESTIASNSSLVIPQFICALLNFLEWNLAGLILPSSCIWPIHPDSPILVESQMRYILWSGSGFIGLSALLDMIICLHAWNECEWRSVHVPCLVDPRSSVKGAAAAASTAQNWLR